MKTVANTGFPLLGIIFLVLGVLKLFQGGNWVVWIILGVLFGGLGVLRYGSRGRIRP